MESSFPQKSVVAVSVDLKVNDQSALFVLLANDGCINRMGNGRVNEEENTLCIGRTDLEVFQGLVQQAGADLLACQGQFADPSPVGAICLLTIAFQYEDGTNSGSEWRYGAESQGPHPVIRDFVIAAVAATEPWYKQQMEQRRAAPLP